MTEAIPLSSIIKDSALQMRAAMNEETVGRYEETIRAGEDLPPIILFRVGKKLYVVDGFHRLEAYTRAGAMEIAADVREGNKREAQFFSLHANAKHGLNLTIEDKRKAAGVVFADAEWSKLSDRKIADLIGASHTFVAKMRRETLGGGQAAEGGNVATPGAASPALQGGEKSSAKEVRAAREAEESQRQADRGAMVAQLPADVRERLSAADAAKAQHMAEAGETVGLPPEDRIAELEAKVESLEAEIVAKDARIAELAHLEAMEADFKAGGVDAVIASERASVEHWKTKFHTENREKIAAQREAKRLRQGQASNDEPVVTDWEVVRAAAR